MNSGLCMVDATTSPALTLSARRRWWANARTSFFWMVIIAFGVRFGDIVIGHTYRFRSNKQVMAVQANERDFDFGFEMGRIGRSLAQGQGFSNPFDETTGATAWEPPLYPFLIAGVFRVFGIYSRTSALVLLSLNSIFSALTCIPIFLIAKRCFDDKVAVWTSWTWALLPSVIFWCTRWVWETSLAALLLAMIFWLTIEMGDLDLHGKDRLKPWLQFGLLWGAAALTNTALLSFLPVSGLWVWYHRAKLGKRSLSGVILASLIFAACITPWLVRNHRTFGQFVFIRSNFGAELRLGNGPGANGTWMDYLHPTKNVFAMRRYRELGELAYVAERKREAMTYIREDYARFAGLSLRRFIYYWGGLPKASENPVLAFFRNSLFIASSVLAFLGLGRALRQHKPGAWLFFWLILSYPLVYYFVFPHPRYRHPIEPELGILIVYVISEAEGWGRSRP
ncbi:MAG TPA: glycosyltransferase family 39 protein [Terriglobales bacterium]|nr:glycosyltransferase family 39 protein [Terriglobales bacterium]